MTGAVAAGLASPVDLVRIRLQGESGRIVGGVYASGLRAGSCPTHNGTLVAFADIARSEGLLALWRGVSANMLRASCMSAGQLTSYDHTKHAVLSAGRADDGPLLHLACSSFSGLVAQIACMPADTVRTRMYSIQDATKQRGFLHCTTRILREHGLRGLYRGFVPAATRQALVMSVQMPLVEQFRRHLGIGYM